MNDLGYLNEWHKDPPEIYKKCRREGHKLSVTNIGRCLNRYTCKECGYFYTIDS